MSAIRIEADLPVESLLQAVEQLSLPDLENLLSQVMRVQAKRKAPSLSCDESRLMLIINQGLSYEKQMRFDELVSKRQDETLTEAEQREFIALITQTEKIDGERLEALIELSRLRGVSLDTLMNDLGIPQSAYD